MNRLIGWATRMYPARWRARYGAEFAALIEDVRPSWRDLWDVVRGAAKMRMEAIAWWKAAALFVGGAAVFGATLLPVFLPKVWTASGETRMAITYARGDRSEFDEEFLNRAIAGVVGSEALPWKQLRKMAEELNLYPDLRAQFGAEGMEVARSLLASNVHFTPRVERTGEGRYVLTLPVRFTYSDASKAKEVMQVLVSHLTAEGGQIIVATYPFVTVETLGQTVGEPARVPPDRLTLAYACSWLGLALWLLVRYPKGFLFTLAGGVVAQRFVWYLSSPGPRICLVILGLAVGFALSRLPIWPRRRAI